uniref:BTB domain-containing protein n=1 Tax=Knipowitschia caucasica TaxID=637954 RepID=A0AAV2JXK4_KNICA
MSDSLETTTDTSALSAASGAENDVIGDERETSDLCWEDAGLPVELQKGMDNLRLNRELTDVVLSVQGEDFPCHRAILAAASHYFRAMFCSGLRESHEERVEMKGLDSETMRILLDYTYTGRALLTETNVQRIVEAASQFQFLRVRAEP